MSVRIVDNTQKVLNELNLRKKVVHTAWGETAEGYAKQEVRVDTGNLKNSITYDATSEKMIVGSNLEYAVYVEMGTGIYAEGGDGRKEPWLYKDKDGNIVWTQGMEARPYLRPSINNHIKEYEEMAKDILK